ncbi:MAG: SET domain-containing protein-lysine N-methyltransferase [Gemmataceae bacterium]
METARGGILREGLGFDRCDVAIVTNIEGGDHLGASDIDTPEQLAYVKSTIVWGVAPWGAAVLNAADPLVVNMKQHCDGSIIYFSHAGDHPVVLAHRSDGGRAVFARANRLILADGPAEVDLIGFEEVPLTQGGRVGFHVENALAAVAAAWFLELPHEALRNGLRTFRGGMDQAPARFNLLNVQDVSVVLDYGHNVSALHRLLEAMKDFPHPHRTVVYSAAGDRRDSDIIEQGELLGRFFDRVMLYEDTYLRGRQVGEISSLFGQGIARGGRATEVRTIFGGMQAIEEAMAACSPGDLLVVQPDRIDDGVALLKQFLSKGGREVTMSEMLTANPKSAPAAEHAAGAQVEIRENRLGKAAYAGRAFRAGELIAAGWGPTTTVRSMHTIQIDHDLHLVPPSPIRFFNHACEPNCGILIRSGVEGLEIHALRDIDEGEEMTLDYETFEVEFQSLTGPCLCSTDGCRGSLKGYKGLSKDLREYYGQYIAQYLRDSKIPAEKRKHASV